MESSTILSVLFGSSSSSLGPSSTTPITTTMAPNSLLTENLLINNSNNDDDTVTSQLIIAPSSASSLFNLFGAASSSLNANDEDFIATTEFTALKSAGDSERVAAAAANAAIDMWNDQQITFEIPSSNDLEKINNLDNFTNLFHRIINNAQQQQQQHNIIDNTESANRLFNTHFDTNGSPVINLADLKTNYGSDAGISLTDDLFNLNNNHHQLNNNNVNLLGDNNLNNLENLLFGNVNMQNLINYLWIGVVTSLIILSVIFIIFSCYFYRKFKEWKKCNKDIRSQMTSTEFYHSQYGPNTNGMAVCAGGRVQGVQGANEAGYYQVESPPCYTIATGLPTYDEALLYYTGNHQVMHSLPHHHHQHLLLHHNNHQYQKSLPPCANFYEKQKEFSYIFINDASSDTATETTATQSHQMISSVTNQQAAAMTNNSSNHNYYSNSLMMPETNNQSTTNTTSATLNASNNADDMEIKMQHYSFDSSEESCYSAGQQKYSDIKNIESNSCLKHFDNYRLQQQQNDQQDFQMTESVTLNSPAATTTSIEIFMPNTDAASLLIKETNFQHQHSLSPPSSSPSSQSLASLAISVEEIENCNNLNLNSEAIGTTFDCNNDALVISGRPMSSMKNKNNCDIISSNLATMTDRSVVISRLDKSHMNNSSCISNSNSNSRQNHNAKGNCTDVVVMP